MQFIVLLIGVGMLVGLLIAIAKVALVVGAIALTGWGAYRVGRYAFKEWYFGSENFLARKAEVAALVAEHNDIAAYVAEIRDRGSFSLGASAAGQHAHLADFNNCSLQVVRNAKADPIKYVMKYFNIRADEPTLSSVEKLGEDIARLGDAITNLEQREASLTESFDPPSVILKFYADDFMKHVGVQLSPITVPYPVYVFQYVSAGGNSGQQTTVTLDTPTIDALIVTMSRKIRFRKSAAGQRALMTSKLRESIKFRDHHTCQSCSISLAAEPHLLLEVDHIVPVSRGGMSVPENLQTLCWRCNRTKSNKLATA